jgi:hypothetical protein
LRNVSVRTGSYGPQIDQSYITKLLCHIIMYFTSSLYFIVWPFHPLWDQIERHQRLTICLIVSLLNYLALLEFKSRDTVFYLIVSLLNYPTISQVILEFRSKGNNDSLPVSVLLLLQKKEVPNSPVYRKININVVINKCLLQKNRTLNKLV